MISLHPFQRVISRPARVEFEGWVSDTFRLQQSGWQLSAQEDPFRDRVRLALRHPGLGLFGISQVIETHYWARERRDVIFYIEQMAQVDKVEIRYFPSLGDLREFNPIDAKPMFTMELGQTREGELFDNMFAPILKRTEEIIVDPAKVGEYLEAIRKAQLPAQDAIRERNRKRDAREQYQVSQRQTFHAQILSLAA